MRWSLLLLLAACASAPTPAPTPSPTPSPAPGPAPGIGIGIGPALEAPPPTPSVASRFPPTRRGPDSSTLHGVTVPDPYRWLEEAAKPDVQAWMTEQDTAARAYLARLPARDALAARFRELLYVESYTAPRHNGKRWFFTRKPVDQEKSIVYYREGKNGADRVLVDPNALSPDGSIALRGFVPSDDGRYVAYRLAPNNADSASLHIRDLETGKDLPEVIENARYATAAWTPDNRAFYYTWLPKDESIPVAERPGYQEVRLHRLGSDPASDEVIYPALHDPTKFIGPEVSFDGHWLFVSVYHGSRKNDVYYRDLRKKGDPLKPLVVGQDHHYDVEAWKNRFYISTEDGAPRGRILRADPAHPAREQWKEIVAERPDARLATAAVLGGCLALSWTKNALSEVELRSLDGKPVRQVALPGLGASAGLTGRPDEDEAYFTFNSYTEPNQIYETSIKTGKTRLWQAVKVPIDTSRMITEQVWYPSKDGTQVSMFLFHKKDLVRDASNPTYLWGYGGFNISTMPGFDGALALFVEHGGVVAIANLRGGGEYGEAWHKAGMLEKKQNVFDDFIGAAEYLIAEKITRPEKLAISGRSNGGLLVGATMTQRPELFKAVICGVPLLDMVRYHLFGTGKTWTEEYGTAEDPALFPAILAYSPLQHVKPGTRYPALLMNSVDSDDRVDPMHARKFVAAIQHATTSDAPVILRIVAHAGHAGADLTRQLVDQNADTFAFLFEQLGMH